MIRSPRSAGSLVCLAALLASTTALADASDPAAAREQLKVGYGLKKDGKCAEAMPHFVESERLDPQSKTLLNMAECEVALGHLVEADVHLAEALDRARTERRPELETIAHDRLAQLEPRLPHLTIVLASGAPVSTQVTRDGTLIGAASMGTPLPVNPGEHAVVTSAEGFGERRLTLTMKERESRTITVSPTEEPGETPGAVAEPITRVDAPPPPPGGAPGPATQANHLPAFVAFGVGAVGLIVGIVEGVRASSQWSDAKSQCGGGCSDGSDAYATRSSAQTSAAISTVGFVVAGVGAATGAVLWVLEDKSASDAAHARTARGMWIAPQVSVGGAQLGLGGRF